MTEGAMLNDPIAYEPEPVGSPEWIRVRALDAAVRSLEPVYGGPDATKTTAQFAEILDRATSFEQYIRGE